MEVYGLEVQVFVESRVCLQTSQLRRRQRSSEQQNFYLSGEVSGHGILWLYSSTLYKINFLAKGGALKLNIFTKTAVKHGGGRLMMWDR